MKEHLLTWHTLNVLLANVFSEQDCLKLLELEKKGERRLQFLLRIYGRYNKLRTQRERRELVGMAK